MKSAFLPVGTQNNFERKHITEGDVVKLVTGETLTFKEMKRTRFIGKIKGQRNGTSVPIWRDRYQTIPYILKVTGERDETVIIQSAEIENFEPGQLFSLDGNKETFMFKGIETKRGGKKVVKAIDLASKKNFNIDTNFTFIKINLSELVEKVQ